MYDSCKWISLKARIMDAGYCREGELLLKAVAISSGERDRNRSLHRWIEHLVICKQCAETHETRESARE